MISAILEQASLWNNQGALQVSHGNLEDAYGSFAMALKLLGSANATTSSQTTDFETSTALSGTSFLLEPVHVPDSAAIINKTEEANAYIYTKTLALSSPNRQWAARDIMFFCALVKFNSALACHLQANKGSEGRIREAFRFYQHSLQYLKAYPDQTDSRRQEFATVLAMACMNNMAQILHEFNQIEKAKVFMNSVRTLLSSLQESDIAVTFDRASIETFVWNEFMFAFTADLVRGAPAA
ncbi:expressed unknown protein [Seminavis robusta]|uniref:Uncharacterized protein n=1 Tax=Seminavis robusta TaxID=568900 RepID=A0A9N8EBK8_9STRA|nr:expressed unknown protein [Seminavis robusta]CAB9515404.1 expressed unknown protein [Seminavis robusta]|eukprot:Sro24_g016200.1 n/a (239) ;mRNA; f:3174-3890